MHKNEEVKSIQALICLGVGGGGMGDGGWVVWGGGGDGGYKCINLTTGLWALPAEIHGFREPYLTLYSQYILTHSLSPPSQLSFTSKENAPLLKEGEQGKY